MLSKRYQNSICKAGFLHKFRTVGQTITGFVERCKRCGLTKHFPIHKGAQNLYMSFHIRDVLRASDILFRHEYPEIKV